MLRWLSVCEMRWEQGVGVAWNKVLVWLGIRCWCGLEYRWLLWLGSGLADDFEQPGQNQELVPGAPERNGSAVVIPRSPVCTRIFVQK